VLTDPVDRWIRLEKADAEAGETIAAQRGVSFSELMRRALRSYLRRHKRR